MPSIDSVVTSLGPVRAHVRPVAAEIASLWELFFIWGAPGRGTGDHSLGLALDFMTFELGKGVKNPGPLRDWIGNEIAAYVLENRKRLNVTYIIWDRRIVSAKTGDHGPWTWRDYDGSNPHTDHVHVSFEMSGTYQPPEEDMPTPQEIAAAVRAELADELEAILSFDREAYRDTTAKLNTFDERERARDARQDAALARLEAAVAKLDEEEPA